MVSKASRSNGIVDVLKGWNKELSKSIDRFYLFSNGNVLEFHILLVYDVMLNPGVCICLIGSKSLEISVWNAKYKLNVGASKSFKSICVWIIDSHSTDLVSLEKSYDLWF